MNIVGGIGIGMALVGFSIIALELLLVLPRYRRLTKHLDELTLLLEDHLRLQSNELTILRKSTSETERLLRPFRALRRWVRHPLAVAFVKSRRSRARARRTGRGIDPGA